MGVILGSAVVPIALCVTWSKANKQACITGAVGGFCAEKSIDGVSDAFYLLYFAVIDRAELEPSPICGREECIRMRIQRPYTLFQFPVDSPSLSSDLLTNQPLKQLQKRRLEAKTLERLQTQLPSYMIPTAYISLDKIPISQTGKTDRQQLRRLGATFTLERLAALNLARTRGCPPETAIERLLQKLWSSVLKINLNTINTGDSFLKLGGDSIATMRLVAAARKVSLAISGSLLLSYITNTTFLPGRVAS